MRQKKKKGTKNLEKRLQGRTHTSNPEAANWEKKTNKKKEVWKKGRGKEEFKNGPSTLYQREQWNGGWFTEGEKKNGNNEKPERKMGR